MSGNTDDLDRPSPIKRFGFALGAMAIIAIVGALFVSQALSQHRKPLRRPPSVSLVRIVAPPSPSPSGRTPPGAQDAGPEDDRSGPGGRQ